MDDYHHDDSDDDERLGSNEGQCDDDSNHGGSTVIKVCFIKKNIFETLMLNAVYHNYLNVMT